MLEKSIKILGGIMILCVLLINFTNLIPSAVAFLGAFILVGIFMVLLFIQSYKKNKDKALTSDIAENLGGKSIGSSSPRINSLVGILIILLAVFIIGFGFVYYLDHF